MSDYGHRLPGQLTPLAGGQSSRGRSIRESIAWAARPIGTGQLGKAAALVPHDGSTLDQHWFGRGSVRSPSRSA
jgi:hypothetical protein